MLTVTEKQGVWKVGDDRRTRAHFRGGLSHASSAGTSVGTTPQEVVSIRAALSRDAAAFLSRHRQESGE